MSTVTREGLTWGLNEDGVPFEETIGEFVKRVQKKRCDTMDARLMMLTGEERLKELLLVCKEQLVDYCIPGIERDGSANDVIHLNHLVEVIDHHIK